MPLSEHEQRILADIEARLRADDPRLADVVGASTVARARRGRLKLAAAGVIVGFVLLILGLQVHLLLGVLGFAVLLASVYQALMIAKRVAAEQAGQRPSAPSALQRYLDAARRRDDENT